MSYVLTRNGDRFEAGDPESYIPDIVSVAKTLARIPRFNGHTDSDYSVAHHCVAGAMLLQDLDHDYAAALFLIHDAHESILGDVPSPLKAHMPGYVEYERRVEKHFMASLAGMALQDDVAVALYRTMDWIIVSQEAQVMGLDDGWTSDREVIFMESMVDYEHPFPELAQIRQQVEEANLWPRDFVPGLYVEMARGMGMVG